MTVVGVIVAMDQEIESLKRRIRHMKNKMFGNVECFIGDIDNVHVVLLKSGIGKVQAAIAATTLCLNFDIDILINSGSAGGLQADESIGDVIIADRVSYYDVDATMCGYELGQLPQKPLYFFPDTKLA